MAALSSLQQHHILSGDTIVPARASLSVPSALVQMDAAPNFPFPSDQEAGVVASLPYCANRLSPNLYSLDVPGQTAAELQLV